MKEVIGSIPNVEGLSVADGRPLRFRDTAILPLNDTCRSRCSGRWLERKASNWDMQRCVMVVVARDGIGYSRSCRNLMMFMERNALFPCVERLIAMSRFY
jgi:hypothetical protein